VCRLKKNRRFNGRTVRAYCRHLYWADIGWLTSGLKVLVVRYDAQYDATNRLTLTAAEMRRMFQFRAQIEEVIRALKDQLGLTRSQAYSERAAELSHLWFGGMLRTGAEEICSSYYYQSTHTATPF
jgi:hypothetical protein